MKRAAPFTFNVLYFAGMAALAPFIVLYYQQLGFSGTQISLLAGLPPLVILLFSPFWTNLADSTGRHRLIMSVGLAMTVTAVMAFPFLSSFAPVMLFVLLLYLFASPLTSLADSATMSMLGGEKEMYGRIRLGGSIGWGLSALLAGALIKAYGLDMAFWGCAMFMFLGLLVSQRFSFGKHAEIKSEGSVRSLLSNPHWIVFLTLALFGGIALTSASTYFSAYMKEIGGNEFDVGIALLVATLTEIPVFFFGDRLLKRFKAYGLLILALIITGIRSLLFAAASAPGYAILAQLLNGLTFPALWIAGVSYADQHAPEGLESTAQGLFGATTYGLGAAVGGFMGGILLVSIGGRALFLVYGVLVLVGVAVFSFIENRISSQHVDV